MNFIKMLSSSILLLLAFTLNSFAINIELDGSIALLSGKNCEESTYRLGTDALYQEETLDIIVEVLKADNEFTLEECVAIRDNVLSFGLKNTDNTDKAASMDIKVSFVKKNTLTTLPVDQINVTNFDLDTSNTSETDDIYYQSPSNIYISQNSKVKYSSGSFDNFYTDKLKGYTGGNCKDNAKDIDVTCRGGVIYKDTSFFYAKLQNDDAHTSDSHSRLIQFSFEYKDIEPLIPETPPEEEKEPVIETVLFNVERIDSDTVDNSTQIRKEALYTQIVGRDFNYALVSYDKDNDATETPIQDVTVRVALIDQNSTNQRVLYEDYLYFDINSSRLKRELVDDLNISIATRNARYKIHYLLDVNGSIVKGRYDNVVDYNNTRILNLEESSESRDNFSIRPETFYMVLSDGNKTRKINRDGDTTALRLAAGYDYNLSITATQYRENNTVYPSYDYNTTMNSLLEFGSKGLCANDTNVIEKKIFQDGKNGIPLFEHDNTGLYTLKLRDNDWTIVDWNKTTPDCILNQSDTSDSANEQSGCIVASNSDLNLSFYPDHFSVNLNMQNMPDSGHDDFLYMSELNSTYNRVGIKFQGTIIAESEDNVTTTNFTKGCVATDLELNLDTTTTSVEGINQAIHTSKGTPVNFARLIKFNNINDLDFNNTLQEINATLTINSNKFLDENKGMINIKMRYNINKHLTEPINPVEVEFHAIKVSSTDANSIAHDKINIKANEHTPRGEISFLNSRRNFYFTRVVSDLNNYPRVNLNTSSFIRTPLNVDIFCKTNIVNYCKDREVLNNTSLGGTTRDQLGWYLSTSHNSELDGNITRLEDNPNIVSISPNPLNDIMLNNGRNGVIVLNFDNCSSPKSTITISTDPELAFSPSEYVVNCVDANASITGIGQTGNILNIKPNDSSSGKMDW